jgi:hypothetical protein
VVMTCPLENDLQRLLGYPSKWVARNQVTELTFAAGGLAATAHPRNSDTSAHSNALKFD